MRRTDILKDTLSCRIHPQLKQDLSEEAFAKGKTTSSYVEDILFGRGEEVVADDYEAMAEYELLQSKYQEQIQGFENQIVDLEADLSMVKNSLDYEEMQSELTDDQIHDLEMEKAELRQKIHSMKEQLASINAENEDWHQRYEVLKEKALAFEKKEKRDSQRRKYFKWGAIGIILVGLGSYFFWFKKRNRTQEAPVQTPPVNPTQYFHGFPLPIILG